MYQTGHTDVDDLLLDLDQVLIAQLRVSRSTTRHAGSDMIGDGGRLRNPATRSRHGWRSIAVRSDRGGSS
jgi:hypothetical protein